MKIPKKMDKKKIVLFGLIDLYIKAGKPIGSNTLRANGFECFSSATIRNYFSDLEKLGYLTQQHSSGGRIPTTLAYREYVNNFLNDEKLEKLSTQSSVQPYQRDLVLLRPKLPEQP